MGDMPHWNEFVKRVLAERQQEPDNRDRLTFANNLTFKKDSENLQKERGKNE